VEHPAVHGTEVKLADNARLLQRCGEIPLCGIDAGSVDVEAHDVAVFCSCRNRFGGAPRKSTAEVEVVRVLTFLGVTDHLEILPGKRSQELSEIFAHPAREIALRLEGPTRNHAEVNISKISRYAREGETIIFPANKPHALSAITRFKMMLTMIRECPKENT
jgi:hypothetical protein